MLVDFTTYKINLHQRYINNNHALQVKLISNLMSLEALVIFDP